MENLLEAAYVSLPAHAKNLLKVLFDWPGGISAPEQTFPEQHSVASVQEGSGFVFFVPGFLFRVSPGLTHVCPYISHRLPKINPKCLNHEWRSGKESPVRNRRSKHLDRVVARPHSEHSTTLISVVRRVIMDVVGYIRKQQRRKQDGYLASALSSESTIPASAFLFHHDSSIQHFIIAV